VLSRLPPALRLRDFRLMVASTAATSVASRMIDVAIGWQVYAVHRSALDLGLIGLAEFAPLPLLALPVGHLADRVSRKLVFAASVSLSTVVGALLIVVSLHGVHVVWPFFALAAANGGAAALSSGARAIIPGLLPTDLMASGLAVRSVAAQVGSVGGPALGGVLFAESAVVAYSAASGLLALGLLWILAVREPAVERATADEPVALDSLLAGISMIRRTPVLLGAISLDLFAVLFGGAIALAPLFARSILDTGPVGLGLLRAAPAAGAVLAGAVLAARTPTGRSGRRLLVVVVAFGACMIVFGLSRSLPLSLAALAASGFVDMFSMNIRSTIAALATPDELRGRVFAVESVFISASNELGAFESGVAAALVGAVPAVVAGGVLTIGLALAWARLFPSLAAIDRLEDLRPATETS